MPEQLTFNDQAEKALENLCCFEERINPGDLKLNSIMQKPYFGTKNLMKQSILYHSCSRKPIALERTS
jgi:hypothetical protein